VAYVDTNMLISYYFDEEENHPISVEVFKRLESMGRRIYISPLTLLELYSVVVRNLSKYKMPPHYMILDEKGRARALVKDILEYAKPVIVEDEPRVELTGGSNVFHVYRKAIDLALELKLRTLDVMHIANVLELARRGLVEVFATLDGEILKRRRLLESLGLRVQGPVGLDSGARA